VATTPALPPHGHGQQKRERRDGDKATHTDLIIAPFQMPGRFSQRARQRALDRRLKLGVPVLMPEFIAIQFDLTDLRGSCVASTYSVEDGPKPVI